MERYKEDTGIIGYGRKITKKVRTDGMDDIKGFKRRLNINIGNFEW